MSGSELDDLLLEAAGRPSTARGNRDSPPSSKRKHKASYSDNGSDDDRNYSNRKRSGPGPHVPLKKRLDHEEDEDDGYGNEQESDDDSVGSDLYKDEDDRQRLAQMSELDREIILADRAAKKSDRDLHDKLRRPTRKGNENGNSPRTQSRGTRSSTRTADRAAARGDALKEIRAKQKRQLGPGSGTGPGSGPGPDSSRKLKDTGKRGYSPVKRRTFTAATMGSSPNGGSDEEESTGDGGMGDSDDDKISSESLLPAFEDIKEITIRRSKLSKWFMEPFFDDMIVNCFVRVGIGRSRNGPIYRLCLVRNVDATDPDKHYKLDNKTTHKYLNVVWGNENSAARWQMTMISDSPPRKEEFDQWVREVERSSGRMPSKKDVLEKKEAIRKTNNFVYSAETVKHMLQQKKSATWRPLNVAAEKDRLRRELEVAKMRSDENEVERIQNRLEELEASRRTQGKDQKAIRLAEMNRRNRVENFKNASESKSVGIGLKAGDSGYDPFSRRWTRSRNYYVGKSTGGEGIVASANTVTDTETALEAAADAGKLVDTLAPVDLGTESNLLHDFELPISLVLLQKFGGPQGAQIGFLARKQRIEATIGRKIPENDGRRHALTLSVSDYKRRRGLL